MQKKRKESGKSFWEWVFKSGSYEFQETVSFNKTKLFIFCQSYFFPGQKGPWRKQIIVL